MCPNNSIFMTLDCFAPGGWAALGAEKHDWQSRSAVRFSKRSEVLDSWWNCVAWWLKVGVADADRCCWGVMPCPVVMPWGRHKQYLTHFMTMDDHGFARAFVGLKPMEIQRCGSAFCQLNRWLLKPLCDFIHTVDGRNSAPPEIDKTLWKMGYYPYQLVQDFSHQQYHLDMLCFIGGFILNTGGPSQDWERLRP